MSEEAGVLVALFAGLLSGFLLFSGFGYTPVPTALHECVDEGEDEEEYDRVHEQADDLTPTVQVEAAAWERDAK